MDEQRNAATEAMSEWLSHPNELAKAPAVIEVAGEFDLYDLHYYIFRFKESLMSEWLLGVCGGFEPGETEHCGHVFSAFEAYEPDTAQEKAMAMVEMVRTYWMNQAAELEAGERTDQETGPFIGFVLLDAIEWDPEQFVRDLKSDWDIDCSDTTTDEDDGALVFGVGESLVAVSLMPGPVPEGEAEHNAANNYMWPDAVEVAKSHVAHLMVAILNRGMTAIDAGQLFVKVATACLKQPHATGIYTSGTVFEPAFYIGVSQAMHEGDLPLFNWIYFGFYQNETGRNGYTFGMTIFGKDEIEIIGSQADPKELQNFLYNIAAYVLASDVVLADGQTIGYTEEQKLAITRSPGVSVDGFSVKIDF